MKNDASVNKVTIEQESIARAGSPVMRAFLVYVSCIFVVFRAQELVEVFRAPELIMVDPEEWNEKRSA